MVSIIENWSKIEGAIKSISTGNAPEGYLQLEMSLDKSVDFKDFPNLSRADEGHTILVNIKKEQIAHKKPDAGSRFSGIVRKAFGQVYFLQ